MAELIIQFQVDDIAFTCERFENFPSPRSAYVAICYTDTLHSKLLALRLKQTLLRSIHTLASHFTASAPPCEGHPTPFNSCKALSIADNQKLLIIVTDGQSGQFANPNILTWSYQSVAVVEAGNHVIIPPPLNQPQAVFWQNNIDEVIPTLYGLLGISDVDQRIFISYRRTETSALAEQLFDALSHDGFEVFLDRFSIEPGTHFQTRLYQELADKAMVVFLESPDFLNSQWIQLEIAFVKKYRLGYLAFNIDGSPQIPSVDSEYRHSVTKSDLENRTPPFAPGEMKDMKLKPDVLREMVLKIRKQHAVSLYRMKNYLNNSLMTSLLNDGRHAFIDPYGFVSVDGSSGGGRYRIWTTPRPPKMDDFYYSDIYNGNDQKIILGPTFMEEKREILNTWLSNKSNILFYNEGEILNFTESI